MIQPLASPRGEVSGPQGVQDWLKNMSRTCFSSDHVMVLFLMVVLLSISLLFVFSPILILSLENNTKGSLSPSASSP